LKNVLVLVTIALTALVCLAHPAGAVNLTGSIAADDAFVLYYGNSDGTGLTQIGSGGTGSQGGINWNVVNGNFVPSITSLSVSVRSPAAPTFTLWSGTARVLPGIIHRRGWASSMFQETRSTPISRHGNIHTAQAAIHPNQGCPPSLR